MIIRHSYHRLSVPLQTLPKRDKKNPCSHKNLPRGLNGQQKTLSPSPSTTPTVVRLHFPIISTTEPCIIIVDLLYISQTPLSRHRPRIARFLRRRTPSSPLGGLSPPSGSVGSFDLFLLSAVLFELSVVLTAETFVGL